MSAKKPRDLRPDEKELWQQIARTTTPLRDTVKNTVSELSKPPAPKTISNEFKPTAFELGSKAAAKRNPHDLAPTLGVALENRPLRMDKKTFGRMKRGKERPEARIDLHGMTAAAAQSALVAFILRSHAEGKRFVLVITGKGREKADAGPIPVRQGVLRRELPHWLSTPPISSLVLQVTEAHQRHGGKGAFYVYLARRR